MSIIERLETLARCLGGVSGDDCTEAAGRIKELERKCDYWRGHYKELRQRIKELEAENTRLNNLYSEIEMRALMAKDSMGGERRPLLERLQANHEELTNARDTAQRRVKELEETLETSRAAAESYELRLTALRQRIADAPVVAWMLDPQDAPSERPQLDWDTDGWSHKWTKIALVKQEDLLK